MKKRRKKRNLQKKQLTALYIALLVLSLSAVGGGLYGALWPHEDADQTVKVETEQTPAEKTDETAISENTESETESETETEPEVYVELTEENRSHFVTPVSCEINEGSGAFVFAGMVPDKPISDDEHFYLMEMKMYEDTLNSEAEPIARAEKDREFSIRADVNENQPDSRLNSKFVVAVKLDGAYVPLCEPQYITNPEALAAYQADFPVQESIKGILVDPLKLKSGELNDLDVKHAAYNIPISNILGETTHPLYPTIHYTYNGRTYAFNGQRIAEYDEVFRTLTAQNITITAILLNNRSAAQPQLIHPLSRDGSAYYYAFNTAEEEGIQTMAAAGAFLAQRYRDREHGIVMNWVVGNEVNVRTDWNYMQHVDLAAYAGEYADAVRVFYNSIRSMNANARVYVSVDQQWDRNIKNNQNYDAKDLLDEMNAKLSTEGNIDWGLAHHPYAYPLTDTTFWDASAKIRRLIVDNEDTSIVTMQNIGVVTDYLQREEMLTADGQVRHVILSELGYSSTKGEANQAAAFSYAYYAAASNPHIDALILSRQTDAPEEVAQDLALGLSYQNGQKKYIYDVFKHIDQPGAEHVTQFAKDIIGISSWSEIAQN